MEHRFRRVMEGLLGVPATEGNRIDVLRNGDEIFPAMLAAIDEAEHTVDLTTYVYWTGDIAIRVAGALTERAGAGVRVRVLLDAIGAHVMDDSLIHQMEEGGCQVEWFRKPTDVKVWDAHNRTHRKVLVCDEDVAFIGGVGIAEEWEGDARDPSEWRDTHFRVRGPAVDGLRAAFVSNWAETGRELFDDVDHFPEQPQDGTSVVQVVQSASQIGWSDMCTVLEGLLCLSSEYVHLTSAYFVPDERMVGALCAAAQRGVTIDVLMPGEHTDKRIVQAAGEADFEQLLDAEVRLWRYGPTMIHAKVMTVDGVAACVGSANFDERSMRLNEEANLLVIDRALVATLEEHWDGDIAVSEQIDADEWRSRGLFQRATEAVTGLFDDKL